MIKSPLFCQISPQGQSGPPVSSSLFETASVWAVAVRTGTLYFSSILQEWQNTKKEWHRLWEIYGSDKYIVFYAPQNSFSSAPQPCVQVIDGRTVGSPCPLLELFMLCFPSQMQIYLYNSDDFDSLSAAIKERRIISAMAIFFEVQYHQGWRARLTEPWGMYTLTNTSLTLWCGLLMLRRPPSESASLCSVLISSCLAELLNWHCVYLKNKPKHQNVSIVTVSMLICWF